MTSQAKPGETQDAVMDITTPLCDEEERPRSTGQVSTGSFKSASPCLAGLVYLLLVLVLCLFLCIFIVLCILVLPLLVVSYLIVRLLQLVSSRDAYYKATNDKLFIRSLMLKVMLILLIPLGLFYLLASIVSSIKHITLYDLSIRHWIHIAFMIIGLYVLGSCLNYGVERLSPPMLWQYERGVNAVQAATGIIDCLILWLAVASVFKGAPPSYEQHQVMGLPTHKWIQVAIFVLIGIDVIACFCHFFTLLFHKYYNDLVPMDNAESRRHLWEEWILPRKYAVYWLDGLRKNVIFVLAFMVLFFSWILYFRTHLNSTPEDKKVVRFVTLALASLLILAALLLIKSCIVLSWRANQVYARLRPRLLENREELYFLGMLGRHKFDILSIGKEFAATKLLPSMGDKVRDDLHIWSRVCEAMQKVQESGSENWCETLHDLQQMAQYFLRAQPILSSDIYVSNMLHYLTTYDAQRSLDENLRLLIKGGRNHRVEGNSSSTNENHQVDGNSSSTNENHQVDGKSSSTNDSQEEYEWKWFKRLVNEKSSRLSPKGINESCNSLSPEISKPSTSSCNEEQKNIEKETLKVWLENAAGTCMELANTLNSAEEVVNCLDNIMSGLLIGATFIVWLLLTGLATTNILVLIASPLLAATFIFGETCKSLFQGIIFAYVCHPFNVGDLIVIDDKMMEVKILGVWKTIFVEIGKTDEVIYPNSQLANKKIINYKSDFDWNDCLEFSIKSFQSDKIETLRMAIKKDLEKEKCSPNHISTEALVTEEDVKVIVHLKYNTDNQHGMTLYERLQEKHNLRSSFSIKIWNLINEHKTKKD